MSIPVSSEKRRGCGKFTKTRFKLFTGPLQSCGKSPARQRPEEMATICKHPRVRIVSRHEDTEFVECLECGEVFDSEEFRDMEIEETVEQQETTDDP
jgi:hypothetical protein